MSRLPRMLVRNCLIICLVMCPERVVSKMFPGSSSLNQELFIVCCVERKLSKIAAESGKYLHCLIDCKGNTSRLICIISILSSY